MKKLGQLGQLVYVLIVVVLAGMILAWFSPLIDIFRDQALSTISSDAILGRMILISLKALLWLFYILLSIFAIIFAVRSGGEGL